MNVRSLISMTALAVAAAAFVTGCPGDEQPQGGGKPGPTGGAKGPSPKGTGTGTAQPAGSGTGGPTKPTGGGDAKFGAGVIKGTVKFSGTAPEMKVPKKRKEADFCKDTEVKYNAVFVKDGKLKDVFVGLEGIEGEYTAEKPATVDQKNCMYEPRMQGVMVGQHVIVKNSDPTAHNINASHGAQTLFNQGQGKGAADIDKTIEEAGVVRFKCDMHSWMRAFAIATENPFFAISGEDGSFKIEKVPDGKYKLYAWHSQFGRQEKDVEVKAGEVTVDFEYKGTEAAPAENQGELNDLF
jgi:plastocyanin